EPAQQSDRVLGDRGGRPGLDIGRRAQLQRYALVAHVRGQATQPRRVGCGVDVVHDADTVAEPVRAAPLYRLPDGRQPERLAGVDGEVKVLPLQVLERVQVARGRVPGLGAGDVETDHADVAEPDPRLRAL